MKKKFLNRINILLGSAIFALVGMNSCEHRVAYGPDPMLPNLPQEEEVVALYGVNMPVNEPVDNGNNE